MTDTQNEPRIAAQFLPMPIKRAFCTRGTHALIQEGKCTAQDVIALIDRHAAGDWGDVCAEDSAANDASVIDGSRTLGAYTLGGEKVWIIADGCEVNEDFIDRRRTATVLLPDEY